MITLININKSFNGTVVLKDINLNIAPEDFMVIVGPSGGGKTTLLRMMNGLASPDSGGVNYNNKNVSEINIPMFRQEVGMVFQEPVMFAGSVEENLTMRKQWDKSFQVLSKDLKAILEKVELKPDLLKSDARSLSGGEKQRLALARVMLNKPKVLLLDEPTANMDPKLAGKIYKMIASLKSDLQLTIILVCHYFHAIIPYATKAAYLVEGEIIESGDGLILTHPTTEKAKQFIAEEM